MPLTLRIEIMSMTIVTIIKIMETIIIINGNIINNDDNNNDNNTNKINNIM